jgi:SHOCT-like domain
MEDTNMQQTFSAGKESKIIIRDVSGDLNVQTWDQSSIIVESDGSIADHYQEGDSLMLGSCDSDLALRVPPDTEIRASNVEGDVSISNVRRVELQHIDGDVSLENVGLGVDIELIGEAIAIDRISGDLYVQNASSLRSREAIEGDVALTNVALIQMERADDDLILKHTETVMIGSVSGDMSVEDIADALSCGNVGGDCHIEGGEHTELTIGNVGSDLVVEHAASLRLGSIAGDCLLRYVGGTAEIGNIGGDASFKNIGGNVQAANIGGDASLESLQGSIEIGNVGGDLALDASFPAGSVTRMHVGGDAAIKLPPHPDLTFRATVGGDIAGPTMMSGKNGNWINQTYGNGAAQLELYVGGDLALRGGDQPRNSSSSGGWGADFAAEMSELNHLGQELGRMGQELGREISAAFEKTGWGSAANWSESMTNKLNEQMRRAQRKIEEQARRAEERARKAGGPNPRVRVRFNEREWQLDPQRLEQIKAQASKAASEGIASAMEAVERAISNLHMPTPPATPRSPSSRPPTPPTPAMPPTPPTPPMPNQSAPSDLSTGSQSAPPPNSGNSAPAPDLDQEREAILRMIAEGRISPEEGDLLLEGLGG